MDDINDKPKRLQPKLSTIKILYAEAANQCSMDGCDKQLIQERNNNNELNKKYQIAEMGHIYPISNKWIRSKEDLSDEEKRDEKNFILVCKNCHSTIDKDNSYTYEKLLKIKKDHIFKMKIIRETALVDFNFDDLEIASLNIISKDVDVMIKYSSSNFDNIETEVKIRKNELTPISRNLILQGSIKHDQVKDFVKKMIQEDDTFPIRLIKSFKDCYDSYKQDLKGDKLFQEMYDFCKKNLLKESEIAASLAILCYLFNLCEVFEK